MKMMQFLRNIFLCLLLGMFLFRGEVLAQEKETIRWLYWDQVPNFILEGKFKGQGRSDLFMKTLQDKLPQYHHVNVQTNARRYHRLIQEENVCVALAWIVPGSKDYRIYSRPTSILHRVGIHTLKSKQHLFGEQGEVLSLAKLLAKPKLKFGHLEGMPYTKRVNDLIERYRDRQHVYVFSPLENEFDLNLLSRNRLDYFLGYPSQARYDAELRGVANKYQFYNLEETGSYASLHTHCSKTPFGEKVMAEVDKILTTEILLEQLTVVEKWNGNNEQYRDVFMEYVIKQKPHKLVTHPGK